jgi:hypothetical protein
MQPARAAQEPVGADAAARLAQAWGQLYTQRLAASAERLPTDDGEQAGSGGARGPPPGRMTALPGDLRCAHRSASMSLARLGYNDVLDIGMCLQSSRCGVCWGRPWPRPRHAAKGCIVDQVALMLLHAQ